MNQKVPPREKTAWDADWLGELLAVKVPVVKGHNYKRVKKDFYRHLGPEPKFTYPHLKNFDETTARKQLSKLRHKIETATEVPAAVKELYADKIAERELMIDIVSTSRSMLQAATSRPEVVQNLVEKLYGKPDTNIFFHLLGRLKDKYYDTQFPIVRSRHYRNLESLFRDVPVSTLPDLQPLPGNSVDDTLIYTSARTVAKHVRQELHRLGLKDWRVVISSSQVGGFVVKPRKAMVVVPGSKIIKARKGERVLTKLQLKAILDHEVGTHVVRAHNGFASPLRLLGVGLAGYWQAEEGIAGYREQLILGADDYTSRDMYFAISIAYGLDRGGRQRTFLETFKLLHDYYYVFHGFSGINSKNKAFANCNRIYRGCTGSGTAYIYTKDIAYRAGNIAIHQLLQKHPEREVWFDVGKFDPTNDQHVSSLKDLGLIT